MASIKSTLLKATLKTISPFIVNAGIEVQRQRQDFLGANKKMPAGLKNKADKFENIKAEWFYTEKASAPPVILYFHGGAYTTGSLQSGRVLASELSFAAGLKTLLFEYRLAPENPFPAALKDALNMYQHLINAGFAPSDIIFAGESAGGGLLLSAALFLRDAGKPLPGAMVCISPWTDLTCVNNTHVLNEKKDPLLSTVYLKESAYAYSNGHNIRSPYISPIFGNFNGMPPALIHTGSDEILLDDSVILFEKMKSEGVDASIKVWEGMWHIWHIFDIPEAREALRDIGDYLRGKYDY